MARKIFMLMFIPIIGLILGVGYFTGDNANDSRFWKEFRKELNENQIEKVIINFHLNQEISLNEIERKDLLELLRESRFESSNRVGYGSTPDGNFTLIFKDREVSVSYFCGSENVIPRFELYPRHLDPKARFSTGELRTPKDTLKGDCSKVPPGLSSI